MTDHDAVWAALSHPARRRIVDELRQHPLTTGELHLRLEEAGLAPSRFATQRYLQTLRDADLVLVAERGRERVNTMNASALYQATIAWLDPRSARIAHGLDHLKHLAESEADTVKEQPVSNIEHLLVEQSLDIAAPAETVWRVLTEQSEAWWYPPFTMLPDARPGRVRLELPGAVGEPVVERDGDRSAVWGELVELVPAEAIAFTSRVCGADAATGTVRITLDTAAGVTTLGFRQEAIGVFPEGMQGAVTRGWQDKLQRIKGHLTAPAGN